MAGGTDDWLGTESKEKDLLDRGFWLLVGGDGSRGEMADGSSMGQTSD